MVYDVLALHEVLPEDQRLFYGIGIHTGSAVLGNVGSQDRREFAAIGDALELSKLLQENAHRGEIIVSAATYATSRIISSSRRWSRARPKTAPISLSCIASSGARSARPAPLNE